SSRSSPCAPPTSSARSSYASTSRPSSLSGTRIPRPSSGPSPLRPSSEATAECLRVSHKRCTRLSLGSDIEGERELHAESIATLLARRSRSLQAGILPSSRRRAHTALVHFPNTIRAVRRVRGTARRAPALHEPALSADADESECQRLTESSRFFLTGFREVEFPVRGGTLGWALSRPPWRAGASSGPKRRAW